MARTARIELEGAVHHVTQRGNRGATIFRDDRDRMSFMQELEVTAQRYSWRWLSYCLMPNHFHLVIETPERTLGLGMRRLAGVYAQAFNQRHRTYGHLFQERFGSVVVDSNEYFAQLLRYVALNPVTAGLCAAPEDWRWSSHRYFLSGSRKAASALARVETLLEVWGGRHGTRYATLFDPSGALATKFGADSPWAHRPPLSELLASGMHDDAIRAARQHGYRLAEIATVLGVHESTVSRRLRRT